MKGFLAKLSLNFRKKNSRPLIFIRNSRWASPTPLVTFFLILFKFVRLFKYIMKVENGSLQQSVLTQGSQFINHRYHSVWLSPIGSSNPNTYTNRSMRCWTLLCSKDTIFVVFTFHIGNLETWYLLYVVDCLHL